MTKKGFTLIDVLIGVFLALIIFLGIFGAFRLGLKVVNKSRNEITATSIANYKIEMVRNLSYEDIGIKGGFPEGILDPSTTTVANNTEYTIETTVNYVIDPTDGIANPEDSCPNDYKKIEVKVSWQDPFGGEVALVTNVAPETLSEECSESGGILSISVFDAYGLMVPFPLIEIKDPVTDQIIKSAAPDDGQYYFSLATSTYKVFVSKSGCSSQRTYGTDEVTTPQPNHPLVTEGDLIELSLSIDETSSFSIDTLSSWGLESFSDPFSNYSNISDYSDIVVSEGEVVLDQDIGGYLSSGYLLSVGVNPASLIQWDELSWSDANPQNTNIFCQLYYFSGTQWEIIPGGDLLGNSSGFNSSPVDLSGLDIATYNNLKIKGVLSSNDPATSSSLKDWQLSWKSSSPIPIPIPSVTFYLKGSKTIGTDSGGDPVYKYYQEHVSDGSGYINISDMEWDLYNFSVDPANGLDLVEIDPSPQPINLLPDGVDQSVSLYLESDNSLLVTVKNDNSLEPIFAAEARLYSSGLGYDRTQYSDGNGQIYFIPLDAGNYDLEVSAPSYSSTSASVSILGDEAETILLQQLE